jgi:hypothetical protein
MSLVILRAINQMLWVNFARLWTRRCLSSGGRSQRAGAESPGLPLLISHGLNRIGAYDFGILGFSFVFHAGSKEFNAM